MDNTPQPLTAVQIADLQKQLTFLKSQLSDQLNAAEEDSQPVQLDQQLVGRLSRMDAMQQQQMAVASRQHVKDHLRGVMLALQAIESEDYGYCSDCAKSIGFARLSVRPEALLCLACQQAAE